MPASPRRKSSPNGSIDDVVAVAAEHLVGLHPRVEEVVAAVAPQGVDALVADQRVAALGAAEDDVLAAAEFQQVAIDEAIAVGVDGTEDARDLGLDRLQDRVVPGRVEQRAVEGIGAVERCNAAVVLLFDQRVELEDHVGHFHDLGRQVGRVQVTEIGIAHDQVGERVGLEQVEQVHALGTAQVVEPVAILQVLHLVFEDEVEGGAQHAAELHDLLGQTADPQVDIVETGVFRRPRPGARQEREAIGEVDGRRQCRGAAVDGDVAAQDQGGGDRALLLERVDVGTHQCGMLAVGGDEIDDRRRVLDVLREVEPAGIGLDLRVGGHGEQLAARVIERWNAGLTAARDVDRGEIERQPEQVVAQRLDDELVDLVADLA